MMILHRRSGFVGFMLTMALGVALGAATLVVSNEVIKGVKKDGTKPATSQASPFKDRANALKVAWKNYDQTRQAYEDALAQRSPDVAAKRETMLRAKRILERAILGATPGLPAAPAADMGQTTTPVSSAETTSTAPSNSTAVTVQNPYNPETITITPESGNAAVPTTGQTSTSSPSSADTTAVAAAPTTGTAAGTAAVPDPKQGMEYIRVKSGDSLSKICQKYYGDSGMWVHVVKYQIPSIAANPHLIFPGQLIALPRRLGGGDPADHSTEPYTPPSSSGSTPATAAPGDESWQERFQKDYVVSDHALTDSKSMTVAEIQAFLDKKGSCLAKPYNGSTPAQMIYDACQKFGISPKVILTRLQCEQGMISKKTASQKDLDWALGVGCYDSGNWNQNFKGFDKQIEGAARTYRRHYDAAKARLDRGEAVTMNIDGETVRIKNAATYAFYQYCPHFHGNKLFYDVWNGYKKVW